jgi:hypothetical protein
MFLRREPAGELVPQIFDFVMLAGGAAPQRLGISRMADMIIPGRVRIASRIPTNSCAIFMKLAQSAPSLALAPSQ